MASEAKSSDGIPIRRVLLNDPSQLPNDYCSTPGGTMFSTTPGGTRIIYDRAFLMQCRNSPLTKSPPPNLAKIPGITSLDTSAKDSQGPTKPPQKPALQPKEGGAGDEPQFEMDI